MITDSQLKSIKVPIFIQPSEWDLKNRTYTSMYELISSYISTHGSSGISWGSITGSISDQTDLALELSSKANSTHLHTLSDITSSGATLNQVPQWNGTNWIPATVSAGASVWGSISGTLSSQTDLQTALNNKANSSHTHVKADILDFDESDYVNPGDNLSILTNDINFLTFGTLTSTVDLEDLRDVIFTSLSSGDSVFYDGAQWVNHSSYTKAQIDALIPSSTHTTLGLSVRSSSDITTGFKGMSRVSADGTITAFRLDSYDSNLTPVSGSINIKVYLNNSLIGSASLSSASTLLDNTLTGWTTAVMEDDKITYEVQSCTGVSNFTLTLYLTTNL